MNPGRELDALIAEKVMGLVKQQCPGGDFMEFAGGGGWRCSTCGFEGAWGEEGMEHEKLIPHFSTDIKAAYEMQDTLKAKSYYFRTHSNKNGWYVGIYKTGKRGLLSWAEASTIPHAICLASLKAVGVEVNPK
jgi:hypothetical protein